jgi:hypothetical protein
MPSQLSASLEARRELAEPVRRADRILMPMLLEHSQTAKALWELSRDEHGRDVLTLALTDAWGSAAADFAPDELGNEAQLRQRFYELIGEMIMPRGAQEPRVRIELRDAFVTADQLEQLRLRLGTIPDIQGARVRLHNQVRFLPQRPDRYLLTDFAIEVNQPFEQAVREAAEACGFRLRDDPWLIQREGVREALLRLVDQHRRDGQPSPEFALCFRLQDRDTIHLLEVSQQAPDLGDGSLEGVGFAARGVVPQARSLELYLAHPNDLRAAFRVNRTHPLFHDLRNGNCEFLFPDDRGEAFRRTFPDLLEA